MNACKDHPNTSSAYLSTVTFRQFRKAKLIASAAHSKLSTLRVDGRREVASISPLRVDGRAIRKSRPGDPKGLARQSEGAGQAIRSGRGQLGQVIRRAGPGDPKALEAIQSHREGR